MSACCRDLPIKEERSPHLWRSDRGNLVADQLPAGLHFCEDDAALELAAGGFAAVLAFQRDPIVGYLPIVGKWAIVRVRPSEA